MGSGGPVFDGTGIKIQKEDLGRWMAQLGPLNMDQFPISGSNLPNTTCKTLWNHLKKYPHTRTPMKLDDSPKKDKKPKSPEKRAKLPQFKDIVISTRQLDSESDLVNMASDPEPDSETSHSRLSFNKTTYKVHPSTSLHRRTSYAISRFHSEKNRNSSKKKKLKKSRSEVLRAAAQTEMQAKMAENYRPDRWVRDRMAS